MAEYREYISALRKCAKEHEKDKLYTGQINTSDLCNDTAKLLENDVIDRSKINKAIEEIKELYTEWENSTDDAKLESNPFGAVLNIIQRNIGE